MLYGFGCPYCEESVWETHNAVLHHAIWRMRLPLRWKRRGAAKSKKIAGERGANFALSPTRFRHPRYGRACVLLSLVGFNQLLREGVMRRMNAGMRF